MNADFTTQQPILLLAEDNISHARLITRQFEEMEHPPRLIHFDNGRAVCDFLQEQLDKPESMKLIPDVMLIDLRLPKVDGLEILKWLQQEQIYQTVPKVVLSSSQADQDIKTAYQLGAYSYLVKPISYPDLQSLIQDFSNYWILRNKAPQTI